MKNISFILLFISLKLSLVGASIVQPKLDYIENKGQWHEHILYKADLKGGIAFLEKDGITYSFIEKIDHHHEHKNDIWNFLKNLDNPEPKKNEIQKGHAFNFKWVNANPGVNVSAKQKQSYFNNYFIGDDENKWASSVGNYKQVVYKNLYYQINALLYSEQNSMKTDYLIKVGGNPTEIKLQYNATDGLTINEKGNLKIKTSINELYELRPYAYQNIGKIKIEVPCEYELTDNILSFKLPKGYDKNYDLIIDPTLIFSTYSGSPMDNWGSSATNDADGNMFLGGIALGQNYPTTLGAFQRNYGGGDSGNDIGEPSDIVITKFNASGTSRIYSTYLGGNGNELLQSLYCTPQNELVILMTTGSINFPTTTNAFDRTFNGGTSTSIMNIAFPNGTDIALTKLNANGSALVGSTFFGGSENDGQGIYVNYGDETRGDIALTPQGDIIIGTSTASSNLPGTSGRFQPNFGGDARDGFIAKFNSNLSLLNWASYFGGSANENLNGIKLDKHENIFICGGTNSNNLKNRTNSFNGYFDGYIAKINSNATQVIASRYLGTTDYDQAFLIDLDDNDNIVLFGQTAGAYPVSSGVYSNNHAGQFIHKLNNQLNTTIFSTVFGSENAINITPTALMVDICGHIYAVGWGGGFYINENIGNTFGMPVTPDAFQDSTDGNDFYFINLNRDATQLIYATYFGEYGGMGDHVDGGTSRFDKNGIVYQAVCASCAGTDWFPVTPGAYGQHNKSNNCNMAGFKFKFDLLSMHITHIDPQASCISTNDSIEFTFTSTQPAKSYKWDFGDGNTSSLVSPKHKYTHAGTYTIQLKIFNPDNCNPVDSSTSTFIVTEPSNQTFDIELCKGQSIQLGSQTISSSGTYSATFKDIGGCDSIITLNVTEKSSNFTTIDTTICQGEFVTINNQKYTNSGIYTIIIPLSSGCDSTITLKLKVNPTNNIRTTTYICKGETYIFDNQILSEPGIYIAKFKNTKGCDSTITMTLNVIQPDSTNIDTVMCLDYPIIFNNQTISAIGSYTAVLKNIFNCDSIVTLNLTAINLPSKSTIDTTICQGDIINFHGQIISTSGTFITSITNSEGCDSTITLNVKTNPLDSVTIDTSICQGQTIIFDNIIINKAGNYTYTKHSSFSCDTTFTLNVQVINTPIQVSLDTTICEGDFIIFNQQIIQTAGNYSSTIQNPFGCDSAINLNVYIDHSRVRVIDTSICAGSSITFNNQIISSAGKYSYQTQNNLGCDSIVTLNLNIIEPIFSSLKAQICKGDKYTIGNKEFTQNGSYTITLTSSVTKCDSIIHLELTVVDTIKTTLDIKICEGDSVIISNSVFKNSGTYYIPLKSAAQCDSLVILNLKVIAPTFSTINEKICEGDSLFVGGQYFKKGGIFTIKTKSSELCDSTITLNLIVNEQKQTNIDTTVCNGTIIYIGNHSYTQTGTFIDTLKTTEGCDSVVTLNLNVLPTYNLSLNPEICEGDFYKNGDSTFTKSGNYSIVYTAVNGCDSTINIQLTVHPKKITNLEQNICEGDSIVVGTQVFKTTGTYTILLKSSKDCDSTVNLNLHVFQHQERTIDTTICEGTIIKIGNETFNSTGNYTVHLETIHHCDSTIFLNLLVNPAPIINAIVDSSIIQKGKQVQLNVEATETYHYVWQNDNISNPLIQNPTAIITAPVWFVVEAENPITNCKRIDSVFVDILILPCNKDYIYIPNAFTPNNDGINDIFRVRSNNLLKGTLIIFDRWGNKVFESDDINIGWDGFYKGNKQQVETYGYYFSGTCDGGATITLKGSITILE